MLKIPRLIKSIGIFVISLLIATNCFSGQYSWTERYVDNTLASETKPEGTATGGGADYILLEAGSDGADDTYNNYGIMITSGTGTDGESKRIIDYDATGNGSGELYAQVDSAWAVNPDATTTYEITIGSDSNNGVAAGVYGGTNGAWRTINYATDTCAAGQSVNILGGREYDLEQIVSPSVNGTNEDPLLIAGYTSSVRDGGDAIIDAQGVLANCINSAASGPDNMMWMNLNLKGSTGDSINANSTGVDNHLYFKVKITQSGDDGIMHTGDNVVLFCEISGTTGFGYATSTGGRDKFLYNYVHDTTATGSVTNTGIVAFNIFDTNQDDGIRADADCVMIHNTFYNTTDNQIELGNSKRRQIAFNNLCDTAGSWNIGADQNYSNFWILGYNNLVNGTSGTIDSGGNMLFFLDIGGNQTGASGLVDPANVTASSRDFNIDSDTTLDDAAFPDNWLGIANTTSSNEQGVAPYEETAAAGGGDPMGWVAVN